MSVFSYSIIFEGFHVSNFLRGHHFIRQEVFMATKCSMGLQSDNQANMFYGTFSKKEN